MMSLRSILLIISLLQFHCGVVESRCGKFEVFQQQNNWLLHQVRCLCRGCVVTQMSSFLFYLCIVLLSISVSFHIPFTFVVDFFSFWEGGVLWYSCCCYRLCMFIYEKSPKLRALEPDISELCKCKNRENQANTFSI